jgi:hypothetical protein
VLTTNQKGVIAESSVIAECAQLGVMVSLPIADARYDLILDVGGRLLRVQCKWAATRGETIVIRCRTCRRGRDGLIHGQYRAGEIDAIAAYCPDTGLATSSRRSFRSREPASSSASGPRRTTKLPGFVGRRTTSSRLD